MKAYIGLLKIHYINYKDEEYKNTICSRIYSFKEFEEAVSLYNFLKNNEIECSFNEKGSQVPLEWGHVYEVYVK